MRFFQQFDRGTADYAGVRHQWLDSLSIDEVMAKVQSRDQPGDA